MSVGQETTTTDGMVRSAASHVQARHRVEWQLDDKGRTDRVDLAIIPFLVPAAYRNDSTSMDHVTDTTLRDNIAMTTEQVDAAIEQFSVLYPFPLDEFQREAIRTLLFGDSVMVAAPTGAG